MKPKDIEILLRQRYIMMDDDEQDAINEMMYDSKTGPLIRKFLGGSIGNNIKVPKPKRMRMGSAVTMQPPGYIGGYDPNVQPAKTVADDKPMNARDGDFIINAAAAEFAGKQDVERMISTAITNLQEKGVDVRFGNPKMNIREKVQLLVSQNEVYVPKEIAKEIGYDRLEKINNRGKKRTQQIQEQTEQPQQARSGGAIKKAQGDIVDQSGVQKTGIIDDIITFGLERFGIGTGEDIVPKGTKKLPEKKQQEGFIQPPTMPKDMRVKRTENKKFFDLVKGAVDMQEGGVKNEAYIPSNKAGVPAGISGVTIGRGVDLGQHTAKSLKSIGFSEDLIKRFKPYLGLQKFEAKKALDKATKENGGKNPLVLESEDAEYISDMMLYHKMEQFDKRYTRLKGIKDKRLKAVLVAEHFGGRLGLDLYKPFRNAIAKPNANLRNVYQQHVHKNPKIGKKSTYMPNAADRLTTWYEEGGTKPVPKLRIEEKEFMPIPKKKPVEEGFIVPEKDAQGNPIKRMQI